MTAHDPQKPHMKIVPWLQFIDRRWNLQPITKLFCNHPKSKYK